MGLDVLIWGSAIGVIHFFVVGLLYGNPLVDKLYQEAQKNSPGVKRWDSKPKYLITQFLGTQIEVFILSFGYIWLKTLIPLEQTNLTILLAALFAGIRVYPRFWNMWIQSTYPNQLLAIEFVNGIISTFTIIIGLSFLL
ncbi:MAG: hypothetical protein R3B45_18165 [Bdellovibrionota bacterium]